MKTQQTMKKKHVDVRAGNYKSEEKKQKKKDEKKERQAKIKE